MRLVQFGSVRPIEVYLKEGRIIRKLGTLENDESWAAVPSSNGVNDSFQRCLKKGELPQWSVRSVTDRLAPFKDTDFAALPIAELMEIGNTPVVVTGKDVEIPSLNRLYMDYLQNRGISQRDALNRRPEFLREGPTMTCIEKDKPVGVLIKKDRTGKSYSFVGFIA